MLYQCDAPIINNANIFAPMLAQSRLPLPLLFRLPLPLLFRICYQIVPSDTLRDTQGLLTKYDFSRLSDD